MQMQMVMVSKKIASWGGELVDNMNINFYNSSNNHNVNEVGL